MEKCRYDLASGSFQTRDKFLSIAAILDISLRRAIVAQQFGKPENLSMNS
jgi:hypothetical protein